MHNKKVTVFHIHLHGQTLYLQSHLKVDTVAWYHAISRCLSPGCSTSIENMQITQENIPVVLEKLLNFVSTHGGTIEGIYRLGAQDSKVKDLLSHFSKDAWSAHIKIDDVSPNEAANACKRFLRNLDECLLTSKLYESWIKASSILPQNDRLIVYETLLDSLPVINYGTLKFIIGHLARSQSTLTYFSRNLSKFENMASRDIRTFFGQGGGDDEKKESERAKKQIEKRKADQKSYDKAKRRRLIQESWLEEFTWAVVRDEKLEERFVKHIGGEPHFLFNIFDFKCWPKKNTSPQEFITYGDEEIGKLVDLFGPLLSEEEKDNAANQWLPLKNEIASNLNRTLSEAYESVLADNQNDSLTAILPIINIMLTISPSTAQCERGFSAMNGLKTQYRTSLNQNSLSHLMRVKVDGPSVKDFNPTDSLVTWINSGKSTKHLKGHKLSGNRNPRPGPAVLADTSSSDGSVENSDTDIASQSVQNKMQLTNLAPIFGPTLLFNHASKDEEAINFTHNNAKIDVICDLLNFYATLFKVDLKELNKEKMINEALEKLKLAQLDQKRAGDILIGVYIYSSKGICKNIKVPPAMTAAELIKNVVEQSGILIDLNKLILYEIICNDNMERVVQHQELVLPVILQWSTWPSHFSKSNYLVIRDNSFLCLLKPLLRFPTSLYSELKYADPKSKSFKKALFDFSGARISYFKDARGSSIGGILNIEDINWYMGSESKRNAPSRLFLEESLVLRVQKVEFFKITSENVGKETSSYFGTTVCCNSEEEYHKWLSAMLVAEYPGILKTL
ncbi:Arf-GAP with Rho-GAP domain, ANK repeat and PH domain-containing protein 3 [Nymphon striatum]|nr:Arf-GAP with Rho-GAP domain, ANK repeat and PH domain-containing protein 3 [Nymphon striatum]